MTNHKKRFFYQNIFLILLYQLDCLRSYNILEESHFLVPGDAKSLVRLSIANEKSVLVASQNNDFLKVYETTTNPAPQLIPLKANEVKCVIIFNDNSSQTQEYYWGSSFQSQSSRRVEVNPNVSRVVFFDNTGKETRSLSF